MNASQFLELIQKADSIDSSELLQLKKVQENFPYFQIPHVLIARDEFQKDGTVKTESLGYAAITSPDRIWLKKLIEKTSQKVEIVQDVSTSAELPVQQTHILSQEDVPNNEVKDEEKKPVDSAKDEALPTTEPPKPALRRRKPPKDDLMETIKRKEKKEILDEKKKEQIDLIRAFSKKSIKLATIKEIEANQNTENLAAASTQINDRLMSESYAKILANQGKKQLAKQIYEKLILKFPDKRSYFADLIEKLKD